MPCTKIAGKGDVRKHISTGFPYTPNLVFTQFQEQWELSCRKNISIIINFNTDAYAHLLFLVNNKWIPGLILTTAKTIQGTMYMCCVQIK